MDGSLLQGHQTSSKSRARLFHPRTRTQPITAKAVLEISLAPLLRHRNWLLSGGPAALRIENWREMNLRLWHDFWQLLRYGLCYLKHGLGGICRS